MLGHRAHLERARRPEPLLREGLARSGGWRERHPHVAAAGPSDRRGRDRPSPVHCGRVRNRSRTL